MKPAELKDEEESTVATRKSIATAEKLVGAKMAEPDSEKAKALLDNTSNTPEYHLHTSEEEEDDTRETRRSVKWVEKRDKHRFWINAREQRDFNADMASGKVNPKQLTFSEDDDEDLGKPDAKDEAAKKLAKEKAVSAAKDAEADKNLSAKDKEAKKVEAAAADAEAKAKEVTPEEKEKDEKAAKKVEAAGDELPPELQVQLSGEAIQTRMNQLGLKHPQYVW